MLKGRVRNLERRIMPTGPIIITASTKAEAENKALVAKQENPARELIVIVATKINKGKKK